MSSAGFPVDACLLFSICKKFFTLFRTCLLVSEVSEFVSSVSSGTNCTRNLRTECVSFIGVSSMSSGVELSMRQRNVLLPFFVALQKFADINPLKIDRIV